MGRADMMDAIKTHYMLDSLCAISLPCHSSCKCAHTCTALESPFIFAESQAHSNGTIITSWKHRESPDDYVRPPQRKRWLLVGSIKVIMFVVV